MKQTSVEPIGRSQLIPGVRQTVASATRGRASLMARRLLTVLVASVCAAACMYALQPRTTLEGVPFDAAKADSVRIGLTEAEVRQVLGEPFEVKAEAGHTHWRYYERFTPRGCNPPTLSQELRVSFVSGAVVSSQLTMPPAWP